MPDEFGGIEVDTDEYGGIALEDPSAEKQLKRDELARQTFEARIEGERAKLGTALADIAYNAAEALSPSGLMNQPFRAVGMPDPYQAGRPLVTLPKPEGTGFLSGLGQLAVGTVEGLTSPEMLVTMPAAGASPVVRALFAGEMAKNIPEGISQAGEVLRDPNATTAQKVVAAGQPLVSAAFVRELARTPEILMPAEFRRENIPFSGESIPSPRGALPPRGEPVAPIERVTPEQAALAAERMSAPFEGEVPRIEKPVPARTTDLEYVSGPEIRIVDLGNGIAKEVDTKTGEINYQDSRGNLIDKSEAEKILGRKLPSVEVPKFEETKPIELSPQDLEWEKLGVKYARFPDGKLKTKEDYTPEEWKAYTTSVIDAKLKLLEESKPTEPPAPAPEKTKVAPTEPKAVIPAVHIAGSTGDRAAVLVKFKNAKPVKTERMGEKYPIYEIRSGKEVLGEGHGTTDAWKQAAQNIYKPVEPKAAAVEAKPVETKVGAKGEVIPIADVLNAFGHLVKKDETLSPKEFAERISNTYDISNPKTSVAVNSVLSMPEDSVIKGGLTGVYSRGKHKGNVSTPTVEQSTQPIPQGPGARTAQTIEAPESYSGTALKNAVAEVERVSYGLPEATPTQRQAMGTAWIKAARVLQENPLAGERLVSEMRNDPKRALTDEDSAVLLRHKVGLENEMNRAAELTNMAEDPAIKAENQARYQMLSDQLLELLDMAKSRGSEWGREGRWRQAIANQDFSLATMEARTRASLGGRRLSESERAQVARDFEEQKATQEAYEKHLKEREAQVEELQMKLAMEKAARAEAGEQPQIHPSILKIANDIVSKLDSRADAARARLKERATRFSAGIDPTVLVDLADIGASHLGHKVLDFAKWSERMISDVGEWVRPHLEQVFSSSQKLIDQLSETYGKQKAPIIKRALKQPTSSEIGDKIATVVKDRIDKKELSAIPGYLQKLARLLWQEGVRDRDEMVNKLHSFIATKVPEITPREVSRMWSGYGDYRQLSKDEISVGLRKMKGELLETAKLEDMAEGRPPLKSGAERGEISEARRQLIKKVNDAKYKFQVPIEDPNTQLKSALDTYKTILKNRITDLEDRMAREDFAPRARRELILDEAAMDLKAKNLRVRQRFEQALEKNRLANRKPWQKLLDNFVKWERAFKLSSPVVFGKLGAAATTRLVTTAAEEALGAGLSKVPVISKIAKQAPREGGASLEGMSRGLAAMVTKGIQDAKQTAKSGMTDLDIILGKEGGLDREWVNLFGQLHGMMKAPIKRFEYELSLQKRIEAAMRNGEDVRNRQTMMKLMAEAMNDGYRSIFMQRGFTADLFNTALHMAETSKKYQPQGEIFARTMRFLLPIVRVPINIVGETATGITGVPVASARTMFHVINGSLKNMDPKVADSIMRQFKKGSIGLGLMAIGFMNPENIGGYDWREKRGANAPKAGGFQIFGANVPRWMTHAPWFELLQFGATVRHAMNNPKKGPGEGALAAVVGLLEETPFYGEAVRLTQAGESGKRFGTFTGEMLRSTLIPQAVQKLAEWSDLSGKKRKPKNWYQHVMYGIPGLRQYVPEDSKQPKW